MEVAALVPGQTATIALRGLGTRHSPYPVSLAECKAGTAHGEAVAGQGLLDLLTVHVGDWIRVTVGDQPQVLHIVDRSIEPENASRVLTTSIDTLRENYPSLGPAVCQVRLRPGADPHTVARHVLTAGDDRLDIHTVPSPADELSPLRSVVAGLILVLALISLIEVLTTIAATVRALKAIGLSPRQITAITLTATGCTALAVKKHVTPRPAHQPSAQQSSSTSTCADKQRTRPAQTHPPTAHINVPRASRRAVPRRAVARLDLFDG